MMSNLDLFRPEVISHKKLTQLGQVFINTPVPLKLITYAGFLITGAIVLLILFGEFSEKYIVLGYLNEKNGIVNVYPNKSGIILRVYKAAGDVVKQGEALFLIQTSSSYSHLADQKSDLLEHLLANRCQVINEIKEKKSY